MAPNQSATGLPAPYPRPPNTITSGLKSYEYSSGGSSAPTYLDANGNLIKKKNLSKQAKQLLHDYQLIQYDMSIGKNYLKDTGFVDLPE